MSSSMLQLVQQAAGEMGQTVPVSVAGNTDIQVVQWLALLNACGYELQRQYEWQAITKQNMITVLYTTITGDTTLGSTSLTNASSISGLDTTYGISGAGINQASYIAATPSGSTIVLSQPATSTNTTATYTLTKVKYAMPSDYDRPVDRTQWDKSKHWEMLGPETAQQWEWLISGYISTGPRVRYRILGNYFQIWPFIAATEVLGFEYISNAWAADSGGTAKTSMTVDTDTCMFPDRVMVLGLKSKYFQAKGFADIYKADYDAQVSIAFANDKGSQTLSFAPRVSSILITTANLPDSGYGS